MLVLLGFLVTALTVVFILAPAIVAIVFDYQAETYIKQVVAGLWLIVTLLIVVIAVISVAIAIVFITGDLVAIQHLFNTIMGAR